MSIIIFLSLINTFFNFFMCACLRFYDVVNKAEQGWERDEHGGEGECRLTNWFTSLVRNHLSRERRARKIRCNNFWYATGGVVAQISNLHPIIEVVFISNRFLKTKDQRLQSILNSQLNQIRKNLKIFRLDANVIVFCKILYQIYLLIQEIDKKTDWLLK